jgi:hypothetical protein
MEQDTNTSVKDVGVKENELSLRNRNYFLGWQCLVREQIMRMENGRPSKGIKPSVLFGDAKENIGHIILLLYPKDPKECIMQFHYMVHKTFDPQIRFTKAVQWLSSSFYQHPEEFGGILTGLFAEDSNIYPHLNTNQKCTLFFDYQQQCFTLPCTIQKTSHNSLEYQFTFLHNRLFNTYIPSNSKVFAFHPNWNKIVANPVIPTLI